MDPTPDEFLPTRSSLLTRLKNWNDQESWREFFDTYWRFIYSVARKVGLSDSEAQDIVQETVIAIAKKMRSFHYERVHGSFKAWLMLNIRSRIADFLRQKGAQKRQAETVSEADLAAGCLARIPDATFTGVEATWDEEWRKNLVEAALERLKSKVSAKQFLIFDLYALKETPVKTVTQAMGVTVGQVYLVKHRLSRLLQAEISKLERGPEPP